MERLPKVLSKEESKQLFYEYSIARDEKIREILICRNLRLVANIAKKYTLTGIEIEELISIGTIGLIKAVDTFDISKNILFATYSARCIENEILMFLNYNKKYNKVLSLFEEIAEDQNGNSLSIIDLLADEEKNIEVDYVNKETLEELINIINKIPKRDRELLLLNLGYNEEDQPISQTQLEKMFGISQSYISRKINKSIEDIKSEMNKRQHLKVNKKSDINNQKVLIK